MDEPLVIRFKILTQLARFLSLKLMYCPNAIKIPSQLFQAKPLVTYNTTQELWVVVRWNWPPHQTLWVIEMTWN